MNQVLAYYQTRANPQSTAKPLIFESVGAQKINKQGKTVANQLTYSACSDGATEFIFVPLGKTCSASTAGAVTIPIGDLTDYAILQCNPTIYFSPNPANVPNQNQQYYLLKALDEDFNRGTMEVAGTKHPHPIGVVNAADKQYFYPANGTYNFYSGILHDYFIGGFAYGFAFDDGGGFDDTTTVPGVLSHMTVTIGPIPTTPIQTRSVTHKPGRP